MATTVDCRDTGTDSTSDESESSEFECYQESHLNDEYEKTIETITTGPYSGEPLADEEWIKNYRKRQEQ